LLAAGLVESTGIVVDAVSGVSGAGRGLKTTSLFAEASDNVSAYGLLAHRHTAEMEQALGHVAGEPVQVLFTPHLVPMTRGILATCYARPAAGASLSTDGLLAGYRDFYAGEPFVHVTDGSPATKATLGSNAVHVTVRYDGRTDTVLAIGALDNLVKGASGQALQNANLVLGLPETTALSTIGLMP
jgi:N-acetyl-gamma-glutamyl-phosphate reductase